MSFTYFKHILKSFKLKGSGGGGQSHKAQDILSGWGFRERNRAKEAGDLHG